MLQRDNISRRDLLKAAGYGRDRRAASAFPLPLTLSNIEASVNGTPVPLQAVTPWQINAFLPQGAQAGSADVMIRLADGATLSRSAAIAHTAPAVPVDYVNTAHGGEVLSSYGCVLIKACQTWTRQ